MKQIVGVFEGGGVKGIALAGGAAAAMDAGYVFERAIGTSAGALVGSLVASGYDQNELRSTVCAVDWPGLLDRGPFGSIPGIGKHLSMIFGKGIYRGDALERVWSELLARKGVRVFGDLAPDTLRVVVTDLTHGKGVVLPDALPEFGHAIESFPVARGVRMSATVPFVFAAVPFDDQVTGETVYMADGALAAKFPIQIVDTERGVPVVGFRLVDPVDGHGHIKIRGPVSLAASVMSAGIGAREHLPQLCSRLGNVVPIPVDRDSLDFALTAAEADAMFMSGYAEAAGFFADVPGIV